MATTNADGSIILKTSVDTSGVEKGFSSLKNGASKVAKVFGTMGVAGASAVAMITKSAVDGYAEYEQLAGGVETLFKDSADVLMGYADIAYETAGLSANEYMATVTSFSASLLQSLGGDTAKSADYANQAIIDMSDNANKMGTSMEMIQSAYQGFAKQNYTMLDNLKLGYGGTKEEMQRLLDDAEKISGIKYDISSFADVTQAIHVIQTELGITGTTAKEASTTIQGSASAMKASWQNLMVGLADENANFDELLTNFIDSVGTFGENLIPRIEIALNGVVKLISKLFPKISQKLPSLIKTLLPTLISATTSLISSLASAFPAVISSLVSITPDLINGIMLIMESIIENLPMIIQSLLDALPILIPQLVDATVSLLVLLMENADEIILPIVEALPTIFDSLSTAILDNLPTLLAGIGELVKGIVGALPTIFTSLGETVSIVFSNLWAKIKDIFSGVGDWFKEKFSDAWEKIKGVFSGVKDFFTETWEKIKEVFSYAGQAIADSISSAVKTAINSVLSTAVSIINKFIGAINTAIDIINAIPGVSISKLNTLAVPQLAKGAVLPPNKPFLAVVGDQKQGTNIEAPLDTIKQGVAEVFASLNVGNGFNGRIEVPIYLDGRQIALAVRDAENDLGSQTVFGGFANAY